MQPYFGLKGPWLTIWITVCCGSAMTLFGYDQGVFSKSHRLRLSFPLYPSLASLG